MARTHTFKGSLKNGYGHYAFIEDGLLVLGESWPHEGGETFRGSFEEAGKALASIRNEAPSLVAAIEEYYAKETLNKAFRPFYKYAKGDEVTLYNNQVKTVIERVNHNGPCYRFIDDPDLYSESLIKGRTKDLVPKLPINKEDCASWEYSEVDPVFICSNCSCVALEYKGKSVASKFCPHCGKYMINHQED